MCSLQLNSKYFVVFSFTGFLYFYYYYLMDKFYFRDVGIDKSLSVMENMGPEVEDLGVSVFFLINMYCFTAHPFLMSKSNGSCQSCGFTSDLWCMLVMETEASWDESTPHRCTNNHSGSARLIRVHVVSLE